jgi:hypothetical protein
MFNIRKIKNTVAFLIVRTSNLKFSRTGSYKKTIGDKVGEWCLLIPLPFNPDGQEQWVVVNQFKEFAICTPNDSKDSGAIFKIEDIAHFLADIKPHMAHISSKLPKIFTYEMFQSIVKSSGASNVYEDAEGNGIAVWENGECNNRQAAICYGRLMESLPNPNEVILQQNKVTVCNFKTLED